jgi:TonB-linked SusC/RagA family outer membrane protein
VPSRSSLDQDYSRSFTHNLNATASYQTGIGNHNFDVLGGYELIDFRTDFFSAFRDNFPLQDFEQLNAGSQENQQNDGSAAENSLQSVFGRLNYDFGGKYLLEANLRYDGSSRFLGDNKWGIFPSFSAGWRISEEAFMRPVDLVDELKLRGSWGQLGNQQIGNYPFAAVVNVGVNYLFGGSVVTGAAQLDLANPNISWEETTTTNVGLDMTLLNNRFDLTFDWFTRKTTDILLQLPVPLVIGQDAPFQNAGEVENTGWELSLGYNDAIGGDFTYDASFNISDINNEVTDLRGAGPFISGSSIIREGDPINSIYGLEADGLFDSQEEIDNHATQPGQIAPGDIRYVDQNNDGSINADDRVIIGNPFPNYSYGFDVSATYRGFDVSAFFQGVGSQDVLLQGDAVWALSNAGKVTTWQADQFWTEGDPDDDYPRLTQTTSHNNFQASSYWVYDASYLRLRNLQVGYTIPNRWANAISARQLRVYFVGQNLFTVLDNMPPGLDPNVPNSTPGAFFPIQKLYSIGVNLSF